MVLVDKAIAKGYTVIGVTASGAEDVAHLVGENNLNFKFYSTDEKVVKTIVRSNPGVIILNKGTVTNKAHWNDFEDVEL